MSSNLYPIYLSPAEREALFNLLDSETYPTAEADKNCLLQVCSKVMGDKIAE